MIGRKVLKSNITLFIFIDIVLHIIISSLMVLLMNTYYNDTTDLIIINILLIWLIMPICYTVIGIVACIILKKLYEIIGGFFITLFCSFITLYVCYSVYGVYPTATFPYYKAVVILNTMIMVFSYLVTLFIKLLWECFVTYKRRK